MEMDIKNLHPLEVKTLLHASVGEDITTERWMKELSFKLGHCNQAFSWLAAKEFIEETKRIQKVLYELTPLGISYQENGTPEERIFELLNEKGPMTLPDIANALGLEKKDIGSAFGQMSKEKVLAMNEKKEAVVKSDSLPEKVVVIRKLLDTAKKNGALEEKELDKEQKKSHFRYQ